MKEKIEAEEAKDAKAASKTGANTTSATDNTTSPEPRKEEL